MKAPSEKSSSGSREENHGFAAGLDVLLWMSLTIVAVAYLAHGFFHETLAPIRLLGDFCHGVYELFNRMWWGLVVGVLTMSALVKVPRKFILSVLGTGGGLSGILRAVFAGLLLDLCSHGILLLGMQLYRRGVSLGQTMAFLIASPWNQRNGDVLLAP